MQKPSRRRSSSLTSPSRSKIEDEDQEEEAHGPGLFSRFLRLRSARPSVVLAYFECSSSAAKA